MLSFKDTKDGYYQFADDAEPKMYAHLTPCEFRPPPPQTPEELAAEAAHQALLAAKAEAKAGAVVKYLRDHTVAECEQYVQDNVTDLASAKAFLKKVAAVLRVLSKEP